jgi:hypothetical protein
MGSLYLLKTKRGNGGEKNRPGTFAGRATTEGKHNFPGLQSCYGGSGLPQEKPIYIHLYSFRHPSGLGWIAWFQREG